MWLTRFEWYRRLMGGTWNYNRYIFDLGRGMIVVWERKFLGNQGGQMTTLKTETY
jgi:hypothetical protein